MALKAPQATGCEHITALADRGYFSGDQVLLCEGTGVGPIVPALDRMCDLLAGHDVAGIRADPGRSPNHNGTTRFSTKAVVLPMARQWLPFVQPFDPWGS